MAHPLRGKTACVGVATAGCGEAPGRNAMEIMVEAVHGALVVVRVARDGPAEGAGIDPATARLSMDSSSR